MCLINNIDRLQILLHHFLLVYNVAFLLIRLCRGKSAGGHIINLRNRSRNIIGTKHHTRLGSLSGQDINRKRIIRCLICNTIIR